MALSAIGTAMKLAPTAQAKRVPVGTVQIGTVEIGAVQIGAVKERVTAKASRNWPRARVDPGRAPG
jgi:hypothetical protein